MERLTVNDLNKVGYDPWELCGMENYCKKGCHEEGGCTKGCHILRMYRKLADYEDLEEQGQLLKPPCKLGDRLYWISDLDEEGNEVYTILPTNPVTSIAYKEDGFYVVLKGWGEYEKIGSRFAYLTYEQAEQGLKEMEAQND